MPIAYTEAIRPYAYVSGSIAVSVRIAEMLAYQYQKGRKRAAELADRNVGRGTANTKIRNRV